MDSLNRPIFSLLTAIVVAVLAGCSADNGSELLGSGQSGSESSGSEPSIASALNGTPGFLHDPGIALIVSPPSSDLSVAYADAALQEQVNAEYVSGEWEKMKHCLGVSAPPPIVLVVDGWVEAGPSDDVLFSIVGQRLATSTFRSDSTNLIRISTYDFDGSQGNPGFHLRSVVGRYLWSVNELAAVGYNTGCASRT